MRLIQNEVKPNALAPMASQAFADTNPIRPAELQLIDRELVNAWARLVNVGRVDGKNGIEVAGDPGRGGQRLQHGARPVRKDQSRTRREPRQRGRRVGIRRQVQIRIHQAVARCAGERNAQRRRRVIERVRRDGGEILPTLHRALHQALQPGVFELLGAPELRQRCTMTGQQPLGRLHDGVHIEQRSVSVEDEGIDQKCWRGICNHRVTSARISLAILCKNWRDRCARSKRRQKNRGYTCV